MQQSHALSKAADLLETTLDALDRLRGGADDRLALVAARVTAAAGGHGWWVRERSGDRLPTRRSGWVGPPERLEEWQRLVTHPGDLAPDDQPPRGGRRDRVAAALEGGSLAGAAGAGLGAWLPELEPSGLAAAGGYDPDARQWLAGVVLPPGGLSPELARLVLTATVQAALGFPRQRF